MAYDLSTDDYLTDDRLQSRLFIDPPGLGAWRGTSVAKWFCLIDGQQSGPVEATVLKHLATSGRLKPTDKVRREDMAQWHLASAVNGLFLPNASTAATSSAAPPSRGGLVTPALGADHATEAEWYFVTDGQQQGPVSVAQLKRLAAIGKVNGHDLIWKEGMADWAAAKTIDGLFPHQSSPSVPPRIPARDSQVNVPIDHKSQWDKTSTQTGLPIHVSPVHGATPDGKEIIVADGPKGFAITGLILGVTGAVISITPCLWMFGVVPDVLGVIFSSLALRKVKAGVAGGKGMAVAGLVCGIIAIVLWFAMMASMGKSMHDLDQSLERLRHLSH